ncbi:MAG TPA: TIR domain-containing protein [Polyangiaceae bacterium]|nr:TIR domain-containing protein [Polyangiaceae bacterium]
MNEQATRKAKLRVVERVIALGEGAMRTAREGRTKRPPVDAFPTTVASWKADAQVELQKGQVHEGWSSLVEGVSDTQLGLELAIQYLKVLKWRLRDRLDDGLGATGQQLTGVRSWLDVLGSALIDQGTGQGSADHYTRAEDTAFASQMSENLAAASEWATSQDSGLARVVKQQVDTIEDRYDGELPYNITAINAWHAGWAMLTTAWLLADVVASSIPTFGHRLCNFSEAQQARLQFVRTGTMECPRCKVDLDVDRDAGGLGRTDFKPIAATCESCEIVIFFPYQALPESIWNGPIVKLTRKEERNATSAEADGDDAQPAQANLEGPSLHADDRKVFVIHGRNTNAAKEMATFLMALGLEPIVFGELSATMGGTPTIADIVTRGMELAQGVIALFTGDEWAELHPGLRNDRDKATESARWQARPNVIFEAGMAFGKARGRVIFVLLGNVDLFTDVAGIHFLRPSNDPRGDRDILRRKLLGMGCKVNDSSAWMSAGDFQGCVVSETGTLSPFRNDVDVSVAAQPGLPAAAAADRSSIAAFEQIMDSSWMLNFRDTQHNAPQFLRRDHLDVLIKYVFEARKPEAEFHNDGLRTSHRALVGALNSYISVSATERVPVQGSDDVYVITTKANSALGHIEDYDAKYSDQVDAIRNAVNNVWATWTQYARLAKLFRVA